MKDWRSCRRGVGAQALTIAIAACLCLQLAACGRPADGITPQSPAVAPIAAWPCTAAPFHTCSFSSDPGWDEYNNPWNKPAMPPNAYRLHAQSHGNWEVVARQAACPTTACAVQAYESAQYDWDNRPGEETISDIRQLTSAFSQRMPTGSLAANGFDAEAAYDIWPNRYGLEVMIWVDTQGQTPAGSRIGSANLGGTRYAVFRGGRTYTFLAGTNVTSGTVNSGDALDWLVAQAGVAGSSYLTQFNFGWEICSTAGKTALFRVTRLDLRQRFA